MTTTKQIRAALAAAAAGAGASLKRTADIVRKHDPNQPKLKGGVRISGAGEGGWCHEPIRPRRSLQ